MNGVRVVDVREGAPAQNDTETHYQFSYNFDAGHVRSAAHWGAVSIIGIQCHKTRVRKEDVPALIRALEEAIK